MLTIPDVYISQTGTEPIKIYEVKKAMKTTDSNKQYHIIDMFWLTNPKLTKKIKIEENEAELCTIGFNSDFGNLRITFYNIPKDAINKNVIFQQSLKPLITGTLYPSACYRANKLKIGEKGFVCIEQLINNTGEQWQSERPVCVIERIESGIILKIFSHKGDMYFYNFEDWQYECIIDTFEFTYKRGLELRGINNICI